MIFHQKDHYNDKIGYFLVAEGEVIEHSSEVSSLIEHVLRSDYLSDRLARKIAIAMLHERYYILSRAEDGYGGKRLLGTFYGVEYYAVVVQPD